MHEQSHDVMTFEEVLAYLRIPRSSLYKLAQEVKQLNGDREYAG
jgi:hypothetical protein